MFGKCQLSQRSESLFPPAGFPFSQQDARGCRVSHLLYYVCPSCCLVRRSCRPAVTRAELGFLATCPGSLGTLGSMPEAATCSPSASYGRASGIAFGKMLTQGLAYSAAWGRYRQPLMSSARPHQRCHLLCPCFCWACRGDASDGISAQEIFFLFFHSTN